MMAGFRYLLATFLLVSSLTAPAWAEASQNKVIYLDEDPFSLSAAVNAQTPVIHYSDSTWVGSFLPGFGQILLDEPLRGGLFVGGFVVAFPLAMGLGYGLGQLQPPPRPNPQGGLFSNLDFRGLNETAFLLVALPLGVYIWNLVDAYSLNHEKNAKASLSQSLMLGPEGQLSWKIGSF